MRLRNVFKVFVMATTLVAPLAGWASTQLNSQSDNSTYRLVADDQDKRIYDRPHKDYHTWNADEDKAYRHWIQEERHENYRAYSKLKKADQDAYWQWRHDHMDWH